MKYLLTILLVTVTVNAIIGEEEIPNDLPNRLIGLWWKNQDKDVGSENDPEEKSDSFSADVDKYFPDDYPDTPEIYSHYEVYINNLQLNYQPAGDVVQYIQNENEPEPKLEPEQSEEFQEQGTTTYPS